MIIKVSSGKLFGFLLSAGEDWFSWETGAQFSSGFVSPALVDHAPETAVRWPWVFSEWCELSLWISTTFGMMIRYEPGVGNCPILGILDITL